MKWQRDDAREVVQIERAALRVLLRTEREELAEDLAMDDDSAHERNQHCQRREPDDPITEIFPTELQAVVERIEPFAAELALAVL